MALASKLTLGTYPTKAKLSRTSFALGVSILILASLVLSPIPNNLAAGAATDFSNYSSAVLSQSPTAYYPLKDPSGPTAADNSGNANNATYVGTLSYGQSGVFPDGSVSSVTTNGDGGYIQGNDLSPLQGANDRTVELWFKSSQAGELFSAGSDSHAANFDIATVANGTPGGCNSPSGVGLYVRFWDDDLAFPSLNLTDNKWHYVAVTVSGSGLSVHVVVDGQQPTGFVWNGSCYTGAQSQPFSMPFAVNTATAPYRFAHTDWATGFVGNLDLAAIYPTALSTSVLDARDQGFTIENAALPNGTVAHSYSEALIANGGKRPYQWTVVSGNIPGVAVSTDGVLSGKPQTPGTYSLTVQVTDSTSPTPGTATESYLVTVYPSHHPWVELQVHPSTPISGSCPLSSSVMTAIGGGWLPGEKIDLYVDTAAGANYIATTAVSESVFATQCVANFLPELNLPGDAQFFQKTKNCPFNKNSACPAEDFPLVAMGSDGDAASIGNLTEPGVAQGVAGLGPSAGSAIFTSSTNWTVSDGCTDDVSSTSGPITPPAIVSSTPSMAPGTRLDASGAAITYNGQPVTLESVNWYGAEEADFVPGGLQCETAATIASEIKELGFNSVRLPWSNAMFEQDPSVCPGTQPVLATVCIPPEVLAANPSLQGQNAMSIYADVVHALSDAGLMVILDNHGADAAWTPGSYNMSGLWWGGQYWDNTFGGFGDNPAGRTEQWVLDWEYMVRDLQSDPYVVGADLRNEPSQTPYGPCDDNAQCTAEWGSSDARENWLGAAQQAGTAILNTNPNLLIFVESTGYATDGFPSPVVLGPCNLSPGCSFTGQVVDSVHYYPGDSTSSWDASLGTTPVWVGEFGMTVACIDKTTGNCTNPSFVTDFIALVNGVNEASPGELGWSWWPINGTHSDQGIEGSSTFFDTESYGLLTNAWDQVTSPTLMIDLDGNPV